MVHKLITERRKQVFLFLDACMLSLALSAQVHSLMNFYSMNTAPCQHGQTRPSYKCLHIIKAVFFFTPLELGIQGLFFALLPLTSGLPHRNKLIYSLLQDLPLEVTKQEIVGPVHYSCVFPPSTSLIHHLKVLQTELYM